MQRMKKRSKAADPTRRLRPTYIRQWREHKNLSLRRLADRLADETGRPIITYASIGRIEAGQQPYSQEALEAIAEALGTDPASLLMRDPTAPDPIWTIWDRLKPNQRTQALAILEALAKAS